MNHLNAHKTGIAFATITGGVHLIWALLVALNLAQPLVNFSLWAHMVRVNYAVGPFDLTAAIAVIVVASAVGYVIGAAFARVFNRAHR